MLFFSKKPTQNNIIEKQDALSKVDRVFFAFLLIISLVLIVRYVGWWFQASHIPQNWSGSLSHIADFFLFGVLSFVLFLGTFLKLGSWFAIWHMAKPKHIEPKEGLRVAFLTCYVPGSEPIEMLRRTLIAMKNVKYPHDTWVLDEGNSEEVKALTEELGAYHFSRKDIAYFNQPEGKFKLKTKAGNLNSWEHTYGHNYEIVAQIDMDNIPHPDFLLRTIGYFEDPKVGFVGIPQVYSNLDNWIARGASEQTHLFYGPMQQGFYGCDMPFFIGNAHIYRSAALKELDGYTSHIIEDHITGLSFYSKKWKGVYVSENLAEGEGPLTWQDYFNQQIRWSYGLFDVLFKHSYKHLPKLPGKQAINYFFSQLFYFTGVASFLGFILITCYFLFGINSANMQPIDWLYYFLPPFVTTHLIHIFMHKYYIRPKKEPVYGFLGMFLGQAAGVIYTFAFCQFILGKKLTYVVTPKGGNQKSTMSSNFDIFTPFVYMLALTVVSLFVGLLYNRDSAVMNLWAFHNGLMLSLIITSEQIAGGFNYLKVNMTNKLFVSKIALSAVFLFVNTGFFYYLFHYVFENDLLVTVANAMVVTK